MEIWRDIPGFEGRYQASDLGRVRGTKGVLKAQPINSGYLVVHLYRAGVRSIALVHRLVAETFVPNPDGKPTVNHKHPDGDKTRNAATNLEWATRVEQMQHAHEHGLATKRACRRPVIGTPIDGGTPLHFESQIAAERALSGAASSAVHHCLVGKKQSAYGFTWARA